MRFAAVQFDIVWEDKPANHRIVEAMIDDAGVPAGAFVVLPELGDTGFSFDLDTIVDDRTLPWATDFARRRGIWLQAGYAIRGADGRGRNCATIVDPGGTVRATYEKIHPFSFGREIDHFSGGEHLVLADCGGATVCPLICYDLRFPELWRIAAVGGDAGDDPASASAEVYTLGASWPAARQSHWRALLIARAIENQAYVVAVNRVGADPHLAYAGGSIVVSPHGEILAEAGDAPAVLQVDADLADLRAWRATFPALRDARGALLGSLRRGEHGHGEAAPRSP